MNVRHGIVVAGVGALLFGCTHVGALKSKAASDLGGPLGTPRGAAADKNVG